MMKQFFPDKAAYYAWMARIPGIFPCVEEGPQNPEEPWASTTEGPYYFSQDYLILRVGSYCALERVETLEEADFYWYVEYSPGQGERVFAAYVWDRGSKPEHVVGGPTIEQAREALSRFLNPQKKKLFGR